MDQGQATSKKRKRPVLITAALLAAVAAAVYFGAKWSYANAVSAHTDRLELAELARSLSPSDPQTNYAVGVLLDDTFDPSSVAGSVAAFKSAVDAGPHNFLLWLRYAQALERSGDRTAARDVYEKALALAPNYAEVQWAYGNFLIRNGESDAGFAYAAKAAAAMPKYSDAAVRLAMAYFDGDMAAVKRSVGDGVEVRCALVRDLTSRGRIEDAVAEWNSLPAEYRTAAGRESGIQLTAKAIAEKRYLTAAAISGELTTDGPRPAAESITDGGFEFGVKLSGTGPFDWTITDGREPQVAMSSAQVRSGGKSLWMVFNTTRLADFRTLSQLVAVTPSASYRATAFYRSELRGASTIILSAVDPRDGKVLASSAPMSMNADWAAISVDIKVPADSEAVILRFDREQCQSPVCPLTGKLWIDDVSIERADR